MSAALATMQKGNLMASEMIEFAVNGTNARGYLATPDAGSGPGVVVLQEWWGLVPQIKHVCDRLASQGYTALAPDLYHGEMAEHTEMDKAGELMTNLPPDRAAKDMLGAVEALLAQDTCTSSSVGVIGFCMGGMLTLRLSALAGDKVSVAAPFYGAPLGDDPSTGRTCRPRSKAISPRTTTSFLPRPPKPSPPSSATWART